MALSKILPASQEVQAIGKNLIINGAMQVWQRGTSQSSNNYSSVDRWTFYAGSGMSVSQSTDVPSEFKYSCSFGGTGNSSGLTTRLEGQDCARLVGKDITVSFYLKQTTGAGSGAIVVALLYADTLDNFGGTTYIGQPTVDTTSDWVRYEVTFTNLPAQAANGLALNFKTPSSSAVVFLITGIQLELDDTATPFEHRSYSDELARCQRYYYAHADGRRGMGEGIGIGTYYSSSAIYVGIHPPVTMRATPSLETTNATNHYFAFRNSAADHFDTFSISGGKTPDYFELEGSGNVSGTAGQGCFLRLGGTSSSARIMFDAEL